MSATTLTEHFVAFSDAAVGGSGPGVGGHQHLDDHGVPCAPVLSVTETLTHPHLVERGTVRTISDRIAGSFQIPGHPVKSSRYPADNDYVAPLLGEHNRDVLVDILGKSDSEVEQLTANGTILSKEITAFPTSHMPRWNP